MLGTDAITVMIVDDIAETRENIQRLLQFEKNIEIVGSAGSGREAVALAEKTKPDVVIMDINMPDMDGIAATELIRQKVPYAQVVILTVQDDPNYMRRAMLAGARDFLTKPPTIDELTSAVRRAGQFAREERSRLGSAVSTGGAASAGTVGGGSEAFGKVITVYSPKGGLGCTTLTVNLGVALHSPDTPVVVVDGKMQFGDVVLFLNEHGKHNILDLASRADALDAEVVESVLITHEETGMKVLAAPTQIEDAGQISGEQFGKLLRFLKTMFEYIVVDTSSVLDDVTLAALDASDLVISLVGQDIPSIKDARLFLDWMRSLEVPEGRIFLVMNRYDKRIGITPERVGESFRHPVSLAIPDDFRHVLPAINKGKLVLRADRGAPISRSIVKMAEMVRRRLAELETEEALP